MQKWPSMARRCGKWELVFCLGVKRALLQNWLPGGQNGVWVQSWSRSVRAAEVSLDHLHTNPLAPVLRERERKLKNGSEVPSCCYYHAASLQYPLLAKANIASTGKEEMFTSQSRAKGGFGDEALNDEDKDEELNWHCPLVFLPSFRVYLSTYCWPFKQLKNNCFHLIRCSYPLIKKDLTFSPKWGDTHSRVMLPTANYIQP